MTSRQLLLLIALILAIVSLVLVFVPIVNPLLLLCPAVIITIYDRMYPAV